MATEISSARPPRSLLLGVFLLSASVLALEVALTRIFSAVLRYHFVFLVISVAVCGLGVGGMLVQSVPKLRGLSLAAAASGFGLSAVMLIVALFKLVLPYCPDALWLIALLVLAPFVFGGMFLAIAFLAHAAHAGLLYAYDLCGAACACLGVVAAMQAFGALNAYLLAAAVACACGLLDARGRACAVVAALIGGGALASNVAMPWLDIPPIPAKRTNYAKPLFPELADPTVGSRIIYSEWDAFARTDVVKDPQAGDEVLLIYTNGHVPTNLVRYDAAKKQFAPQRVIAEVPFSWRKPDRVLCIGPGAGLDLILAKNAGARRVDGVEVNPAIPRILQRPDMRAFGGDPYHLPGVRVVVGDGRTFVMRARGQYDLIFLALTKTATSSAGMALVEGYIYTREAFADYWARLSPRGQIVFVTDGFTANVRLMTTALDLLLRRGMTMDEALDRVALLTVPPPMMGSTPYEFALIVSQTSIRGADADRLFRTTRRAGYQEVFIPGEIEPAPFDALRRGEALDRFAANTSSLLQQSVPVDRRFAINLMPVSDDSPFFLDLTDTVPPMLLPLLFGALGVLVAFSAFVVVTRARGGAQPGELAQSLGAALYFACLGLGFMLIEIPLVQRLILILGHPTLALTVVLAALLLGGGLGSAISQRFALTLLPAWALVVAVVAWLTSEAASAQFMMSAALATRALWSGGICFGLGLFLGMPFPLGLRALGDARRDDVPWMWAVNGITSVLGSLLAAIGAKLIGFHAVSLAGACTYLVAAVVARVCLVPKT